MRSTCGTGIAFGFALAVGGCKTTQPVVIATPATAVAARSAPDVPRVTEPGAVVEMTELHNGGPVVWIGAGALAVGTFDVTTLGELMLSSRTPVELPAIRTAVLDKAIAHGGAAAKAAKELLAPPEDEPEPMALEEGRMGKRDSDRAEGQYRMKKESSDPSLARQQAIEQARAAGVLGAVRIGFDGAAGAIRAHTAAATGIDELSSAIPLVLVTPGATGAMLARVVVQTGAMLGVARDGKLAVIRVGYQPHDPVAAGSDGRAPWLELHADAVGLHLIGFPAGTDHVVPWKADTVDRDALLAVYAPLKDQFPDVDVVVRGDTTAQRVVDILVSLDAIEASGVSLGEASGTAVERIAEVKAKIAARPREVQLAVGQPSANGDLDKSVIRDHIRQQLAKIQVCYENALLSKPTLAGTVLVSFFITPNGSVATASATGVDPEVANCVSAVIKAIEFPKPRGGGGVQVNYPFVFRSTP